MSINIDKAIQYFLYLKSIGVKYSWYGSRTGKDGTADCSGALYQALVEAGANKLNYVPSTETLHNWLISNGYYLYAENKNFTPIKGDVAIWGKKGQSALDGGHTGMFYDNNEQFINVRGYNGSNENACHIDDYDTLYYASGGMYSYVYRLKDSNIDNGNVGSNNASDWKDEAATFYPNTNINLRTEANTNAKTIAIIGAGQGVKYDKYKVDKNGYVWIRQPRSNGYGYMATGTTKNGVRNAPAWGVFK